MTADVSLHASTAAGISGNAGKELIQSGNGLEVT